MAVSAQNDVRGLRYIDDLVLNRQDSNADGDYIDSGDFTHYALSDHQFSVIALIDSAANLIERVSYTPYGEARHHWMLDVDGDGDIDATDEALVTAALYTNIYQSGYNVDADFNRDGKVDKQDSALIGSRSFRGALPAGWISSLTTGNVIGFSGYVFNREIDAGGLYTVRFRHYDPVWGRWTSRDRAGYRDGLTLYGYVSGRPLIGVDPTGQWLNIVGGAIIGGIIGGGAALVKGLIDGDVDWGDVGAGAIGGAVSGALVGSGLGLIASGLAAGTVGAGGAIVGGAAVGAGAELIGNTVEQILRVMFDGGSIEDALASVELQEQLISALAGLISGGASGGVEALLDLLHKLSGGDLAKLSAMLESVSKLLREMGATDDAVQAVVDAAVGTAQRNITKGMGNVGRNHADNVIGIVIGEKIVTTVIEETVPACFDN